MRHLVAVGIVLAAVALPTCAQHGSGSVGGARGGAGIGHAANMSRGGFQRGVRQANGGGQRIHGYGGAGRGYGAQRFNGIGGAANRPMFAGRGLRDGDRDGDDRGRGYGRGFGRGERFGEGRRDGGIPYLNPYGYGYGYPLMYSGLTYAGDLGYGGGGGYDEGANGDDADDGSSDNGSSDNSGQGYDNQPPIPYAQGSQDEGPAGYQGNGGDSAYPGNAVTGDHGYGQPSGYQASGYQSGSGYPATQVNRGSGGGSGSTMRFASNRAPNASLAELGAVTLVFKDGRTPEKIHNYALTRTTLYVTDTNPQEIPVADLDLAATEKVNRDAGVKFQLPQ